MPKPQIQIICPNCHSIKGKEGEKHLYMSSDGYITCLIKLFVAEKENIVEIKRK